MKLGVCSKIVTSALLSSALFSFSANATIVEFITSQGNFKVNLHDESTPLTVANFMEYVNEGDYDNTIIHRTVDDFVMQGGGYYFDGEAIEEIDVRDEVNNEPVYSNVEGTIAMAKRENAPNSATSQWFVNVENNSSSLDATNGGYTVFGEVIEGMDVVETISELHRCSAGGPLTSMPMPDFDCTSGDTPGVENFVTIEKVVIVDSSTVTDADLNSKVNTLINEPAPDNSGGGSSGSFSFLALFGLGLMGLLRRKQIAK